MLARCCMDSVMRWFQPICSPAFYRPWRMELSQFAQWRQELMILCHLFPCSNKWTTWIVCVFSVFTLQMSRSSGDKSLGPDTVWPSPLWLGSWIRESLGMTHLLLAGPVESTSDCSLGKKPGSYFPCPIFMSSKWGWTAVWSIFASRSSIAFSGWEWKSPIF